jgi:hypothetical protein
MTREKEGEKGERILSNSCLLDGSTALDLSPVLDMCNLGRCAAVREGGRSRD